MPTALAISPHLDDAVFSAGGLLARLSRQGWRVVIATVFTASVPDPKGFALACQLDKGLAPDVDYMELRRAEDAAACAVLGAEAIWLPFPEAPHRGYGSAAELFQKMREDDDIVQRIAPALEQLVEALAPDTLLAPQAIGAHVDHVAVHFAMRGCRQPSFWADFPYAARPSPRPSPFADELAARPGCELVLSEDEITWKVQAALAYASQLGFQFGGTAEGDAMLRAKAVIERFVPSCEDTDRLAAETSDARSL